MHAMLHDRAKISGAARITPEGYFVADALVAKAGNVQAYRASELGLTDRDPSSTVRVFRPEAEVFAVDSLKSASRLPITLDHPSVMVDANNWREYAKGETGEELLRDGEFLRVPIRVTDAGAVASVQTDRQEFSLGYAAEITLGDGVSPTGEAYDATATSIRYNHLAACRTARGGPQLRIVDERTDPTPQGVSTMPHIVMVDGLPVDVANPETAAAVVKAAVTGRDTANAALEASQTALNTANTTIAARDAEIVTLKDAVDKAKLSPQQLRDAAASYSRTVATAKALGATVTDAMDEQAVKAAVVAHKLPGRTYATDAERNAAFDVLAAAVPAGSAPAVVGDALANVIGHQPVGMGDAVADAGKARSARFSRFETAHQGNRAAAAA